MTQEEKINQSLQELERNLQEVLSAKKQVESVVNAHSELKESLTEYVASLASIQLNIGELVKKIENANESNLGGLEQKMDEIKKLCDNAILSFDEQIKRAVSSFGESIEGYIVKINDATSGLSNAVSSIKVMTDSLRDSIKVIEDTKTALDKILEELVSSQTKQDETLDVIKDAVSQLMPTVESLLSQQMSQIETMVASLNQVITSLDASLNNIGKDFARYNEHISQILNGIAQSIQKLSGEVDESKNVLSKKYDKQISLIVIVLIVAILSLVASMVPIFMN